MEKLLPVQIVNVTFTNGVYGQRQRVFSGPGSMLQAATATPLMPQAKERRRHSRVPLALLGRYMLPNFREYPCQTVDVSPGGLRLTAPVPAEVGQRVIVYLEHLGRIEGIVVRRTEDGFAMTASATARKREKLAAQLTWLANRQTLGLPEDRRHERVVPRNTRNTVTLASGEVHPVRLLDVSLSGAAFQSELPFLIGDQVMLGKTQCRVVRKFAEGYAVEFFTPIAEGQLNDNVSL